MLNGLLLDHQSRCEHWHSPLDIIAIKFYCCQTYYACFDCHQALADHKAEVWPRSFFETEKAVLCGVCGVEMTIKAYLTSNSQCPGCGAAFNPKCAGHWELYFEGASEWKHPRF